MENQPFCHKCGTPYSPYADFCKACGMPLSLMATSGPYESILARGFAFREAKDNPRKPIIVIGILLIFGPMLIGCACALCVMVVALFSEGIKSSELPVLAIPFLLVGGGLYVSWKMISTTLRNYFSRKKEDAESDDSDAEDFEVEAP